MSTLQWHSLPQMITLHAYLQELEQGTSTFDPSAVDVVVAPTFVHLARVKQLLVTGTHYAVASQNLWTKGPGAYTGEMPAEILMVGFTNACCA